MYEDETAILEVEDNPELIKYLDNQTEDICQYVVSIDGLLLEYVREQTLAICKEAVRQNPLALEFCHKKRRSLCTSAVSRNGLMLKYVPEKYHDNMMYFFALGNNGNALKYIEHQTEVLCIDAVRVSPEALVYVQDQTATIVREALRAGLEDHKLIDPVFNWVIEEEKGNEYSSTET